uniref:Uncharacterized protein n=1 Tax=Mus musculus TaxID=10090 RepID=Q9D2F9_MOUSE|nr:unnamed protein product [Mus musculus]
MMLVYSMEDEQEIRPSPRSLSTKEVPIKCSHLHSVFLSDWKCGAQRLEPRTGQVGQTLPASPRDSPVSASVEPGLKHVPPHLSFLQGGGIHLFMNPSQLEDPGDAKMFWGSRESSLNLSPTHLFRWSRTFWGSSWLP